jgi:signal transduction histidine kinase
LKHEGEILGSLAIAWEKPAVFDVDTREFLFRVAALLTTGVLNERLWRQLERRARELESLTESLQQALKLREQMIQNVSHELRTPLAILQGYIELMREEALGPLTSEQREALEVMQERLNGLIRYVELLLTLQEIQAGARSLNILDLRELVREACRAYQSRLDPQRHALRVHLPDHPVWVMGEGERLLLTLTELLENAVKFSPAGGRSRSPSPCRGRKPFWKCAMRGSASLPKPSPGCLSPSIRSTGARPGSSEGWELG